MIVPVPSFFKELQAVYSIWFLFHCILASKQACHISSGLSYRSQFIQRTGDLNLLLSSLTRELLQHAGFPGLQNISHI